MSPESVIRALVVDDSAYNRVTISRMLEGGGIDVAGSAVNGEDAIRQVMRLEPDVITLDLEMPVMDGFSFLRWLMQNRPTSVIVVSSRASDRSVFKALDLGAIDFIAKPGGRISPRLEEIGDDLIAKIRQIHDVRIENVRKRIDHAAAARSERPQPAGRSNIDLVVIGSSTGGPPALQHLLQRLALLPVPIVVAQHMPPVFTRLFAERVDRLTAYSVKEARDGERLVPATAFIAPGGMQTEVQRGPEGLRLRVTGPSEADIYAPSVDRLFATASDCCGERLVAVVMTGMGDDGAASIRRVRERGGKTIAESADTAIIFGMPGEAIRTGAIDQVLPLDEIGGAIESYVTFSANR